MIAVLYPEGALEVSMIYVSTTMYDGKNWYVVKVNTTDGCHRYDIVNLKNDDVKADVVKRYIHTQFREHYEKVQRTGMDFPVLIDLTKFID